MTAIDDLWRELSEQTGRFGLAVGERAGSALAAIAQRVGAAPVNVSRYLTIDHPDGWRSPEELLDGHTILDCIEVLFSPEVPAEPLRLMAMLARRGPVVASWPGEIANGRATFSRPGRRDHFDQPLPSTAVVLRAIATTFPDEVPYEVERFR